MTSPRHDRAFVATIRTSDGRPALAGAHATLFCRVLAASRARLGFLLHAYVILPDRARLVLATADGDPRSVAVIVHRIRTRFAREMHARHGWSGRIFRDDAPLALVRGTAGIERRAESLHRDPVVAGLTRHARAWTWSSARAWAGMTGSPTAIDLPVAPDPRRASMPSPRPGEGTVSG
jgi:hypothetical protein